MDTTLFRKNVLKTVSVKGIKLGMRSASKSSLGVNIAHAVVGFKRDIGYVFQDLQSYILGLRATKEMENAAIMHLGDVAADLAILCRVTKVHMPTATKKAKLTCTRTAALLQLDSLATEMLELVNAGVLTPPKMAKVTKMVVMPQKGGVKEEREVEVVDTEAELAAFESRLAVLQSLLNTAVDLFWKLCFNITGLPPQHLFDLKMASMQKEYPEIEFELVSAPKPEMQEA